MKNKAIKRNKRKNVNKSLSKKQISTSHRPQFHPLCFEIYTDAALQVFDTDLASRGIRSDELMAVMSRFLGMIEQGNNDLVILLGLAKVSMLYAKKISVEVFSPRGVELFRDIEEVLKEKGCMGDVDEYRLRIMESCGFYADELVFAAVTSLITMFIGIYFLDKE